MVQLQAASGKEQWRTAKKGHGSRSRLALAARAAAGSPRSLRVPISSWNPSCREAPPASGHMCLHVAAACARECATSLCHVIATSSRDRETRVASALERGRAARQRTGVQCQCAVGPWEARAREKYFYNNIHRAQGAAAGVGARHSAAPLGTGRAQRATEPQCIKPVPRGRLALLGAVQTSSSNDALLPNFVPDDVDDDSDLSGMRNPTAIGAMPPISLSLSLSLSLSSLCRASPTAALTPTHQSISSRCISIHHVRPWHGHPILYRLQYLAV